jgi:hypothetical protein
VKKTIYLHIGTFKTGTASIQQYLFSNFRAFEDAGFFVPKGKLIGHHELPISLVKEFTKFRASWPEFSGDRKAIWDDLIAQIEKTKCNKIIISSENFCDIVNEHARDYSEEMGQVIKSYFSPYQVKVIVYLRNIDDYTKSMHNESIKVSSNTLSYPEVLNAYFKHRSIHVHPSIYLDYYAKIFGKENIIVKKYSKDTLKNDDVVDDFLGTLAINLPASSTKSKKKVNLSLSDESVLLKRIYNITGAHGHEHNKHISNFLISLEKILTENSNYSVSTQIQELINVESQYLSENYNIDINTNSNYVVDSNDNVSLNEGFIMLLNAIIIKQNNTIISKLNKLEDYLAKND